MQGPLLAPDFLTPAYLDTFYASEWEVHYNSSRTGIRLLGPKPEWVQEDGGDAGLHPSNVHDNAYAFGAIDFTGDMPIILGPDGPSLGGFVCPAAVAEADRWKLGSSAPGISSVSNRSPWNRPSAFWTTRGRPAFAGRRPLQKRGEVCARSASPGSPRRW